MFLIVALQASRANLNRNTLMKINVFLYSPPSFLAVERVALKKEQSKPSHDLFMDSFHFSWRYMQKKIALENTATKYDYDLFPPENIKKSLRDVLKTIQKHEKGKPSQSKDLWIILKTNGFLHPHFFYNFIQRFEAERSKANFSQKIFISQRFPLGDLKSLSTISSKNKQYAYLDCIMGFSLPLSKLARYKCLARAGHDDFSLIPRRTPQGGIVQVISDVKYCYSIKQDKERLDKNLKTIQKKKNN